MEPPASESPLADPEEALARLEELRQAGETFLRNAHARLEEAQQGLLRAAGEFPERVRSELSSLDRMIAKSRESSAGHLEGFRKRFLSGVPSEEEFRAHLLMLDMEYSGRLRLAEDGIRLLLTNLDNHLQGMGRGVERYCAEARDVIGAELYPAHARLVEALKEASRQLRAYHRRLSSAVSDKDLGPTMRGRAMEEAYAEESWRMMAEAEKLRRTTEGRVGELEKKLERARADTREAEASARRFADALQAEKARQIAQSGAAERLSVEAEDLRRRLEENAKGHAAEVEALQRQLKAPGGQAVNIEDTPQFKRAQQKVEELRRSLREAQAAREGLGEAKELVIAREQIARLRRQLTERAKEPAAAGGERAQLQGLKEELSRADQERSELRNNVKALRKRLLEAEQKRSSSPDAMVWAAERAELEERLTEYQREAASLRAAYEANQISWEQTLARQDAARLDEIFRLRAQIDDLRVRLAGGMT